MLTRKKMIEYCKQKKINVPRDARTDFLRATIVRASLHGFSAPTTNTCFGFWQNDDATCITCDCENKCFEVSIGMSKEEYFKKMDALEGHRMREVKKMRKE